MKKTLNILTGGLFALFFVMALLPTFNQLYFYIKHISLYLFAALLSVRLLLFFYRRIKTSYVIGNNKLKLLQLFTIVFLGVLLYLIGDTQRAYIEEFETASLVGCTYYDDYDNILYSSQFYGGCPKLENVSQSEDSISFQVIESASRIHDDHYANDVYVKEESFDVYRLTEISIKYTINHLIEEVSIISSTNFEADAEGEYSNKYLSLRKDIKNVYSDDSFSTTHDYYFYETDDYTHDDLETIEHYAFTEEDRNRKIVSSEISYDLDSVGHIVFSVIRDDELSEFGTGLLTESDDPEYNILIDFEVQPGSDWAFVGNHYLTYIGDNKIMKHNYYSNTDNQSTKFFYERTHFNKLILTESLTNSYGGDKLVEYESYKNSFKDTITIEDGFMLSTLQKSEYGYLLKEYTTYNFNCHDDDCPEIGNFMYDWYYWNSVGYSMISLYDYEHLIYSRSLSKYLILNSNPLISVYYE